MKKLKDETKTFKKFKSKNDIKQKIKTKISSIKKKHRLPTEDQEEAAAAAEPKDAPETKVSSLKKGKKLQKSSKPGEFLHQATLSKLLPPPPAEESEEEEALEIEDQDEEEEDWSQLPKLVEQVTGKKGKPNFAKAAPIKKEVKVNLEGVVNNQDNFREALKLARKKAHYKLDKALHKHELVKLKRGIAYQKEVEEVSQWDDIVETNREVPQIVFPLHQPDLRKPDSTQLLESTPLEKKVAEILRSHQETPDSKPQPVEVEEALDVNLAILRHQEILKARALLSYQAAAAKRQKRIKSKKNRKFEKIRRLKEKTKDIELLMETDPGKAQEQLKEESDRMRIEERMSLKHKNTTKWAKLQKLRAKYNPEAREALEEQSQIARQLTQKSQAPKEEEDESEASDSDESLDEPPSKMAREEFNQGFLCTQSNTDNNSKTIDKDKAMAIFNKLMQEEKNLKNDSEMPDISKESDTTEKVISDASSYCPIVQDLDEDEEDASSRQNKPSNQFDDILEVEESSKEFAKEKQRTIEKSKLKDLELYLEGWGTWAGPGIKESARKKRRFLFKAPIAPPRKDQKLPKVIINEEKCEVSKHQVKSLPFPFGSVKQFEASIRQPIGREWCTENSLRELSAPPVVTKKGAVINPISRNALKTQ